VPTPGPPLFPYTTLFRSRHDRDRSAGLESLLHDPALLLVRSQPAGPRAPPKRVRRNRFNGGVHLRSTWTRTTCPSTRTRIIGERSEEHTSELQSPCNLVC